MLKLILCFVIVMSSAFVGFSFSQKLSNRLSDLNSFSLMLSNAHTKIRYTFSPLSEVFSDNFLGYSFSSDKPFCEQWQAMLKKCDTLKKEDIKLLTKFASELGTTDCNGQLKNIELYLSLLSKNISSAENDINSKSKLYRIFGFSFGIVVSILLI